MHAGHRSRGGTAGVSLRHNSRCKALIRQCSSLQLQLPSAFTSHVKEADAVTEHATVEPLALHPAAQFAVHDSESSLLIKAAATAVSMRPTHKRQRARGWIARERCQRSERACRGGAAGAPHRSCSRRAPPPRAVITRRWSSPPSERPSTRGPGLRSRRAARRWPLCPQRGGRPQAATSSGREDRFLAKR